MASEPIYQGGLLRCCVETLVERTEPGVLGEVVQCKYEPDRSSARMVLREDGWHWVGLEFDDGAGRG